MFERYCCSNLLLSILMLLFFLQTRRICWGVPNQLLLFPRLHQMKLWVRMREGSVCLSAKLWSRGLFALQISTIFIFRAAPSIRSSSTTAGCACSLGLAYHMYSWSKSFTLHWQTLTSTLTSGRSSSGEFILGISLISWPISAYVLAHSPPDILSQHLPASTSHRVHCPPSTADDDGGAVRANWPPFAHFWNNPSRGSVNG